MSKTHVIDGVTYVEVERKAEVGEKVIIVHYPHDASFVGSIYKITSITDYGTVNAKGVQSVSSQGIFYSDEYRVLEPLESEEVMVDQSQASEQVIEMFATLSRKIVSLERQLADTQRNLETFAEQTENNSEDIRTLDERTQPKGNSEINRLADFILKHYGHEIGLGNPQEGESAVDVAIRLLTPVTVPKYLVNGGTAR